MSRDNQKCVKCGSKDNLLVHHIDGSRKLGNNSMNNELSNLITLCYKCHAIEHGITKEKQPKEPKELPTAKRNHDIVEMVESGMTYAEVGTTLGISRQRIHQIYKRESNT